ncbi:unnamed protein product, partial [Brassica rapa]
TETPEEPATVTVIEGVLSEPINVLVEVAVIVASGEENDGEDDVHEDKELESVVEGDKDGDEEDDDDEEGNMCRTGNYGCNFKITIQHIPRAQNTMADKLARGARNQPAAMVYVDSIPPRWLLDQESS